MIPKNTKKSAIHENADANINCDFDDSDINRLGVAYLTHVLDSDINRLGVAYLTHVLDTYIHR